MQRNHMPLRNVLPSWTSTLTTPMLPKLPRTPRCQSMTNWYFYFCFLIPNAHKTLLFNQANVGGTLGLCTGFSIVSLYEIVYLLVRLLERICKRFQPVKVGPKRTQWDLPPSSIFFFTRSEFWQSILLNLMSTTNKLIARRHFDFFFLFVKYWG